MSFNKLFYEAETFQKISFQNKQLEKVCFEKCLFERCDFSKSALTSCSFVDCLFKQCQFTLTTLNNCRLQGVTFSECKLVGVDFTYVLPKFLSLKFEKSILDACNFSHMPLPGTSWKYSTIKNGCFTNSILTGSDFRGCRLSQSLFHHTHLEKANFEGATEYAIDPLNNPLKGARFSKPEVMSLLQYLGIIVEL